MGARIDILGNLHCQFETRPGNISRRAGCEHCRNKRVNGYVRLMKTDFFLQSLKMTFIRNFRRILVTINNNQQMHGCNCFESCLGLKKRLSVIQEVLELDPVSMKSFHIPTIN